MMARTLLSKVFRRASRVYLSDRYPEWDIGPGSYGRVQVKKFGNDGRLYIGAYSSFASGVQILLGGEHRTDWVTTYPFSQMDHRLRTVKGHPASRGDVRIGSDVWVGREAMILSGVTIGDGAVIGARSVVSRDVPPYGVASGNPATLRRTRFPPEQVERLLAAQWWSWPRAEIDAAMPKLLNGDIESFLAYAEDPQRVALARDR